MGQSPADERAARLLEAIGTLTAELQPGRRRVSVTLDSHLERDLGFDSLSRAELLARVERTLDVELPEHAFNDAETPRDLLRALPSAGGRRATRTAALSVEAPALGTAEDLPAGVDTLVDVLAWRARHSPERPHVRLYEGAGEPVTLTYADLLRDAQRRAAGLQALGVAPGDSVALMLPTGRAYLECFFAILLAGAVPAPIYPPARPSQLADHLRRHARILDNARAATLVTVPEGKSVARLLRANAEHLRRVVAADDLLGATADFDAPAVGPDDLALLQYTSGSTGQPKGVMLSHRQLIANIRAMGETIDAGPDDVFVSWLPLYHDMGLIGAWLGSLYYAMLCVLMPPVSFLARPWRWLQAIHRHRASISAAPNFAYEMCVSRIPDAELAGLDLGSWRFAFNGAEPVSAGTLRRFAARFAPCGFRTSALAPVYGLAECGVGLAFPPPDRGPLIERIRRGLLERDGRAELADADDTDVLEVVACGQPLPGYEIRVVDAAGRELGDGTVGRLEFRGPSATRGYVHNPAATAALFHGDWLDSGDLAYLRGGDVYLTSRVKDLIIRAGRNIHPYELEEAVGDLTGIRKGCVAVFGADDPEARTERLIVVAETRVTDADEVAALRQRIETLAVDVLGVAPDDVRVVPPHSVLKTSSGKIRRLACRDAYESGRLGRPARGAAWQAARLWLSAALPQWRRARRAAGDLAYAGWVYTAFGALFPAALLAAALPTPRARWRALGAVARTLLRLAGVPLRVTGAAALNQLDDCVIVANHASYADGLVLLAALPGPVAFVAKTELRARRLPRWFLGRLGCLFVERFDTRQSQADAGRLRDAAAAGAPLLVFVEGTFTRSPGLRPFHLGAFVAAAEAGLPAVPVAIGGTRSVLRGDDWFPRRGTITVSIGGPLPPQGRDWAAALQLRDASRRAILEHLDEPDLAAVPPP